MIRRILLTPLAGVTIALLLTTPAAAVTAAEKLSVMSSWSQPNSSSYNAWNSARQNQSAWAAYAFDWSTDYCSNSPDQPSGFDFRLPCYRHDFGYRNYKAMGAFDANKSRIDDSFYFDLKAKCATYSIWVRAACYSLAWTYYQAVRAFGSLSVSQSELDRAERLKAAGLAQMAAHT
jgi:hypothetical protein